MDPVTMMAISSAGGGMLQRYGSFRQAQNKQRAAEFNADMLDLQASDAISRGQLDAQRVRQRGKSILGTQRSGYASQGVDVSSGTAALLADQTGQLAEQDAIRVKLDAMRQAWGLKSQATMMRWEADINLRDARRSAITGAVMGVANAAASMGGGANAGAPSSGATGPAVNTPGPSLSSMVNSSYVP